MRLIWSLCILSVALAFDNRRCLLYGGSCVTYCPRNMHPYHTRCDGLTMSQRTCDDRIVYVLGYTCGWSRCDCNGDLLLDEVSGFCVTAVECTDLPEKLRKKLKEDRESKRGKRLRMSKRIRVKEDDSIEVT